MAEKNGVIAGFRDFVMRGNVIDLAVAVVVGAAFTAVVKSFTDEIINPVIAAFGGTDTAGFGFCVRTPAGGCTADAATFVDFGAVFSVLISFAITMAVIYFIFVVPMNKARARMTTPTEEVAEQTAVEVVLLTEIRDLLVTQAGAADAPALSLSDSDTPAG
ncbi:MAG: large conductance mechanosensitive channel protein MscL [Candidatus Nanopelagicales bacterium]